MKDEALKHWKPLPIVFFLRTFCLFYFHKKKFYKETTKFWAQNQSEERMIIVVLKVHSSIVFSLFSYIRSNEKVDL